MATQEELLKAVEKQFGPMPIGAGDADEPEPWIGGLPKYYSVSRDVEVEVPYAPGTDQSGRIIVPNSFMGPINPKTHVYEKDAVRPKDRSGRTIVPNNFMGPINPKAQVYEKDAALPGGQRVTRKEDYFPQYREGAQYQPANWEPGELAELQRNLVAAGLLPKKFKDFARWDNRTLEAYESLLEYANQAGRDENEMMEILKQHPATSEEETIPGKPIQVRDPKEIAAVVKATGAKVLGRSLTSVDVDRFVSNYQQMDRQAQEAIAAAEAQAASTGENVIVQEAPTLETLSGLTQEELQKRPEAKWQVAQQRMQDFYSLLGEAGSYGQSR